MAKYTVYEGYYYGPGSGAKRKYDIDGEYIREAGFLKTIATIEGKEIHLPGDRKHYWTTEGNDVYYITPETPIFGRKIRYSLEEKDGYIYVTEPYKLRNVIVYTVVPEDKKDNNEEKKDTFEYSDASGISAATGFILVALFIPFIAVYILFDIWGETRFEAVFTGRVYPILTVLLPLILALVTYKKLSPKRYRIPVAHALTASAITLLAVLAFCIMVMGDTVAEFAYDLLPNDDLDIGYYFLLPLFTLSPVIVQPLLLRFVLNKKHYGDSAKNMRESVSVPVYCTAAAFSLLIIIGREIITEVNIINALLAVLLLMLLEAVSVLIGYGLRTLLSKV